MRHVLQHLDNLLGINQKVVFILKITTGCLVSGNAGIVSQQITAIFNLSHIYRLAALAPAEQLCGCFCVVIS
jgi:hypothetical protein